MFYNRKFELASVKARAYVDLRDYEDLILATVKKIIPNATVVVKRDCYIVDRLTEGQSRKLGRALSKTKLIEHGDLSQKRRMLQLLYSICPCWIPEKTRTSPAR